MNDSPLTTVYPGAGFCDRVGEEVAFSDLFMVLPVLLTQDDTTNVFITS
jgi:hypothetical protein